MLWRNITVMNLTADLMLQALTALDRRLDRSVRLIVGGGGAMLLAHHFALSTADIDAVPASGMTILELEPLIQEVARELSLAPDWLNPYYSTFAHVLPSDYGSRLVGIGSFLHLKVDALSKDDLLIMKCFAARQKDVVHARVLVRQGARTDFARAHIGTLDKKRIPGAPRALRFLEDIEKFFRDKE